MNKNIDHTTEHEAAKNLNIISTLIYKAISSQLSQDKKGEEA
ncbi:hypothetical protein [Oceanobacillus sp. FSL K6-3682]